MGISFSKATKKKQKARVALIGAAGSGKTYTSLVLAKNLGHRIAVIDTERGSAAKYSGDVADFDVCELPTFKPSAYVEAIRAAGDAGFDVLVIDSLSHAWEGEGGILDQVDKRGGKFDAWRDMSPQTRDLIEAILGYPGHVIATMRAKTEYVVEKDDRTGKSVPRKVGLAPKFKDGLEFEFDLVGTLDEDNVLRISKSRAPKLSGQAIAKPGRELADALRSWLDDGVGADEVIRQINEATTLDAARDVVAKYWKSLDDEGRSRVKAAGDAKKAAMAAARGDDPNAQQ